MHSKDHAKEPSSKTPHLPVIGPQMQQSTMFVSSSGPACACEGGCPRCRPQTLGEPLPQDTQHYYKTCLGQDFSAVRVHTSASDAALAQALHARAFTQDNHIVFNQDQYAPSHPEGQKLLAHELTHVVQQRASGQSKIQRAPLEIKAIDEIIEELLNQFEGLVKAGKPEEARALIPKIKSNMIGSMAMEYGGRAADAFFSAGATQEALAMLTTTREAKSFGSMREKFSLETAEKLLNLGTQALKKDDPDNAYKILNYLVKWMENSELMPDSDKPVLKYQVEKLYPKVIEALMAVPQYHQAHNNATKAQAQYQEIKAWVSKSSLLGKYGVLLAKEFMGAGLHAGAFEILETTSLKGTGKEPYQFIIEAVDLLLPQAKAAQAKADVENAYRYYLEAYQWLQKPGLKAYPGDLGEKRGYKDRNMYEVMLGLLSLVDIYIKKAEVAYCQKDPQAAKHMADAEKMLDRIQKDVPVYADVIAAKVEQKDKYKNQAYYQDVKDPAKKIPVQDYPENVPSMVKLIGMSFEDKRENVISMLIAKQKQIEVVKTFYGDDKAVMEEYEKKYGKPPDISKLEDRRNFWLLKYKALLASGKKRPEALETLVMNLQSYLQAFTMHTYYDIPDAQPEILTDKMPQSITGQLLLDCGAYALRTAYELSLIKSEANLNFYFVFLPNHAMVGIIDKDKKFGWYASNDTISKIKGNLAEGVGMCIAKQYSSLVPVPFTEKAVTGTSAKAIRKDYLSSPGATFLPPKFDKLSKEDKEEANVNAMKLKLAYFKLRSKIAEGYKKAYSAMESLKANYPETGELTEAFKALAKKEIEALFPEYSELSLEMEEYYDELVKIYGEKDVYTKLINPYYFKAVFSMMRYLVHVLGVNKYETHTYVKKAIYEKYNLKYKGVPPPWEEVEK